jgi:hypothetical protein
MSSRQHPLTEPALNHLSTASETPATAGTGLYSARLSPGFKIPQARPRILGVVFGEHLSPMLVGIYPASADLQLALISLGFIIPIF